ncbi:hypothetical protein BN946_scf185012.g12 [Trametes cinnabarina]|uniref:DUF7770 domain-containing protein n=1 Tax=Pycnoporus cinnabarinus TaxID=5643 RepID=A0A060SLY4_PYCCI|nr:hypothetical protein BN946_scf185012.g12 [Trametes cinnabarina]
MAGSTPFSSVMAQLLSQGNPFAQGLSHPELLDTNSIETLHKTARIRGIRFVLTTGGPTSPAFHFRLFLELDLPSDQSIELHAQLLSSHSGSGKILAMSRKYLVTNKYVYGEPYHVYATNPFTFEDMHKLLFETNGRHRYMFDVSTGKGCGYWALTVIGDLERAGYLRQGSWAGCAQAYSIWAANVRNESYLPAQPVAGRFF